jgi:hypothetical protein
MKKNKYDFIILYRKQEIVLIVGNAHIVPSFITEVLINCEVVLSYRSCMKGKEEQVENKNVFAYFYHNFCSPLALPFPSCNF